MPRVPALLFALALAGPAPALNPEELARYVPAPVNAVASVSVQQLLLSPRAQKEGWAKIDHTEYLAGAVPLNPRAKRMVIASEFVPSHPAHGGGVLVAETDAPLDFAALAKAGRGEAAEVAGEPALVTPGGMTLVSLAPNVVGGMTTPHRPELARWVKGVRAEPPTRSRQPLYLNKALYDTAPKHHILVAVDTDDLFTCDQLRATVAASAAAKGNPAAGAALDTFIGALRGVRFTADLDAGGFTAVLHIDSGAPAAPAEAVKKFVLETLDRAGAPLTDLRAAAATAAGNSVALKFRVTDGELARILSPFVAPASGLPSHDSIPVAPDGATPEATARYLRAADSALADVGGRKDAAAKLTDKAYQHAAVWYQAAAQKLDTLSTVNVDPAAVAFARGTAGRLRAVAGSLEGVPIEAAKLDATKYAYGGGGAYFNPFRGGFAYSPWGGGGVSTNIGKVNNQIVGVIEKDAANRETAWQQIEAERARLRGELAGKYGKGL